MRLYAQVDPNLDQVATLDGGLLGNEPLYEVLGPEGHGSYGVVLRAQRKETGSLVAIKLYKTQEEDGVSTSTLREIALLKELHHTNVIKILNVCIGEKNTYMVMEHYDMDLSIYMWHTGRSGMTIGHIKSFMHQLVSGLEYCHQHRIIHRDLKPQNLLLKQTGRLCIADFGLSTTFRIPVKPHTPWVATLAYRAPELVLEQAGHYSLPIDLWSVGCIFAEMMMLSQLFHSISSIDHLMSIFKILGTPNDSSWPGVTRFTHYNAAFPQLEKVDLKAHIEQRSNGLVVNELASDLLESLLRCSPARRISAQKAVEHPFFYDVYEDLSF